MNRRQHKKKLRKLAEKRTRETGLRYICRYDKGSGVILREEAEYMKRQWL